MEEDRQAFEPYQSLQSFNNRSRLAGSHWASFVVSLDGETLLPGLSSKGVYLLTCPKTREQYVGSATGPQGFFGRWLGYVRDGHGGNEAAIARTIADEAGADLGGRVFAIFDSAQVILAAA